MPPSYSGAPPETGAGRGFFVRIHNGYVLGVAALTAPTVAVFAPLGLAPLLGLSALAVLVVLWRQGRLGALRPGAPGLMMAAIFAWAIASLIWSTDRAVSLDKLPGLAGLFAGGVLVMGAAKAMDDGERGVFGRLLVTGVVAALALLLVEWLGDGPVRRLAGQTFDSNAARGVSYNRGVTALALAVWPAAMLAWRHGRRWALGLLALALAAFAVQSSGSAIVGLLLGMAAFGLARRAPRRGPWLVAAAAVLYIAASPFLHAWLLTPAIVPVDGAALQKQYPNFPRSAYHRYLIWNFAAEKVLERPVLGWGFRTSRVLPDGKVMLDTSEQAMPLHPHNGVLQVWVELGGLGAVLLAGLCLTAIRRIRQWPVGDGGPAMAVGLFATAYSIVCTSYGLWQSWWMSAILLAVAFCIAARPAAETR
jgi:O-antigen ligase